MNFRKYATDNGKVFYESQTGDIQRFNKSKHGKSIDNMIFCGEELITNKKWIKENL